jgi:hypothetical protein
MRTIILGITFGLLAAWGLGSVKAQEHQHHPAALHDKFYSKWNQPPTRETSCCNKDDCSPTEVRILTSKLGARVCQAWKWQTGGKGWNEDGSEFELPIRPAHWVVFSCDLLEENRPDPEESPDGYSHACIAKYTDQVYCAVRGSLQ